MQFYNLHNILCRTIQVLCENGADHLLTDIEGNFPKDLAEKNHHNKCSKYLVSLGNSKTKTKNSSTKTVSIITCITLISVQSIFMCEGYIREKQFKTTTKC